ncbi:MAG: glycosyltransferase family 9 protein [Aureispira sp.]|nr:glycosyltransferase family 9 protein [Aureispira sp.]
MQQKKFLVIQTAFIGDAILATALLEKLHSFYPDAQIDYLVRKGNEGLLEDHPFISNLLILDKKQKYKNFWSLLKEIRKMNYDVVINPHRFAMTGLLTGLSKATQRIGFRQNPFSWLYTQKFEHKIGTTLPTMHEVERNQLLIAALTDKKAAKPRLYPLPKHLQGVPKETSYICIAPSSVWFTKQWPVHKWIELIHRLDEHLNIYLIGGPGDRELCEQILKQVGHPNVQNKAGQLSFLESAAWIGGATMNYTNDSGPLHIASAMDAPITAVFCSTVPAFGFTPLSTQSKVVQSSKQLDCRPCGLHGKKACPKGHFNCAEIDIKQLLDIT